MKILKSDAQSSAESQLADGSAPCPAPRRSSKTPPKARILVADDEQTVLFAMQRFLERAGYWVDCAQEREEAEALLMTSQYDLLIADLRLSDAETAEGLELVHFARRLAPDIQTVILTAFGSPGIERLAEERGVSAFLQKPQPLAVIAEVVAAALNGCHDGPQH